jgi:hypothetical protein
MNLDWQNIDKADFRSNEKPPFFVSGVYKEEDKTVSTFTTYVTTFEEGDQKGLFEYGYECLAKVETNGVGGTEKQYYSSNKVKKTPCTGEDISFYLDQQVSKLAEYESLQGLFSVTLDELKNFSKQFKGLCATLQYEKQKTESEIKVIEYSPKLDFNEIYNKFSMFVSILEEYLNNSFNRAAIKINTARGIDNVDYFVFLPWTYKDKNYTKTLIDNCRIEFCLLPRAGFAKSDFTRYFATTNTQTDKHDIFYDWIDIKSVTFDVYDTTTFLNYSDSDVFTVYRSFLFGNYENLRDSLAETFVRGILQNMFAIQKMYFDDGPKKIVDWQEFCGAFLRPVVVMTFKDEQQSKTQNKTLNITTKPLKTLQERLDSDSKINEGKKAKVKVLEDKEEETDSGLVTDIIKELKSAADLPTLYEVLNNTVLKNLASASADCVRQFVEVPTITIPNIDIPTFKFDYSIQVTDISGGMYKKFLDQLLNISFKNAVKKVEKFFTVRECEDLKRILNKNSWKKLFVDLKEMIKKEFTFHLEATRTVLEEMSTLYEKDFCDPELYLLALYKIDDIFEPDRVSSLLRGELDIKSAFLFIDFLSQLQGAYFPDRRCILPDPSEINMIFKGIGPRFVKVVESPDESLDDPDIFYGTAIKCESAFDSFLDWLNNNGFSQDSIDCIADKSLSEKNSFMSDLYQYINDGGASELDEVPEIVDESLSDTSGLLFNANFDIWFKNWPSFVKSYKTFSASRLQPGQDNVLADLNNVFNEISTGSDDLAGNTGGALSKLQESVTDSGLYSGAATTGAEDVEGIALGTGQPFWDSAVRLGQNEYKPDTLFDKRGIVKIQHVLQNGQEIKVEYIRDNSNFLFPRQEFVIDGTRSQFYQDVEKFEHTNKYMLREFSTFYETFAESLLAKMPFGLNQEYPYMKQFFEDELFPYLQEEFYKFVMEKCVAPINKIFKTYNLIDSDSSIVEVNGFDVFCNYLEKITAVPSVEQKCSLFSKDEWMKKLERLVRDDFKQTQSYRVEASVNRINFLLKIRVALLFYKMISVNIIRFYNSFNGTLMNNFVFSRFQDIIEEYLLKDYEVAGNKNLMADDFSFNFQRFTQDYLKSNTTEYDDLYFENLVDGQQTELDPFEFYDVLDLIKRENSIVSRSFSAFINEKEECIFENWLKTFTFKHFDDHIIYIPEGSGVKYYYNNIDIIKNRLKIFLEVSYKDGEERKLFKLINCSDKYYEHKNMFVKYTDRTNVSILDLVKKDVLGTLSDVQVSLCLCQLNEEGSPSFLTSRSLQGVRFGDNQQEIGYVTPLCSVLLTKKEMYDSFVNSGHKTSTIEDQINFQEYAFSVFRKKLFNSDSFRADFVYTLALDKIYDLCGAFMFQVNLKTTGLENLFNIKTDSMSASEIIGDEYSKNKEQFINDTYGTIRQKYSLTDIQKMALQMALDTPKLIFKMQVEMSDPNIKIARKIVDVAKLKGKNLDIRKVSLIMLLPSNIWPPPVGIGPPITPQGILYLFLDAKLNKEKRAKMLDTAEDSIPVGDKELRSFSNCLRNSLVKCEEAVEEEVVPELEETCMIPL